MKTYFLYLVLVLTISVSKAQPYKNVIVPTEFGNVNASAIYKNDNKLLIRGIFGNNQSCLFDLDDNLDLIQHYIYDSMSFSRAGLNITDNGVFALSKNRSQAKGLQIGKLKENFTFDWKKEIITNGEYNFPTSSTMIDGLIYNSFFYKVNNVYMMGLNKTNTDGNSVWTRYYEPDVDYIYPWDMSPTRTKDLLISYNVIYTSGPIGEGYGRVVKIDSSGEEIWKSDLLEGVDGGSAPLWFAELSDSSIFVTFKKDMHKDPDFFMKLHPYPPTYVWLDKDGRKVREHILRISRDYEVYISEVKAGRGDYFYVYGGLRYFDTNDDYGFITKYANNGDTIWTHRYRHPAFDSNAYIYYVNDMVEEENGDLTVLGAIAPIAGKNEVWVFRVNSEGCYGTQTCDDLVLSTHGDVDAAHGMTVYPNPTTGILHISGLPPGDDVLIRLYSIDGRPVLSRRGQATELDISRLAPGIYLLQADTGTSSRTVKIMKR